MAISVCNVDYDCASLPLISTIGFEGDTEIIDNTYPVKADEFLWFIRYQVKFRMGSTATSLANSSFTRLEQM